MNSTNATDLHYLDLNGQPWGYVLMAMDILIIFPIFFGNLLVLIAFKTTPKLQIPINLLFVNLAITDIIFGLVSIPMHVLVDYAPFGLEKMEYPCIFGYTFKHIPLGVSCITILSIGIIRGISVTFPFQSKSWITIKRVKMLAVSLWVYFITLIMAYAISVSEWEHGTPCDINLILGHTYTFIVCGHVVGVAVISTGFYVLFIIKMRRSQRKMQSQAVVIRSNTQIENRKTKMVMTVMGCYYLCWFPAGAYIVAAIVLFPDKEETHTANIIQHFALFILFCNSFVNPIIYAGYNPTFKKSFKNTLSKCFSTKKPRSNSYDMTHKF